jgi:hypothetical protein
MNNIKQFLKFIRVVDEQGNLSLTNLALLAALYNVAVSTEISTSELLVFIGTIVGYQVKRFAGAPTASTPAEILEIQEAVKKLETKVAAVQVARMLNK